MIRWFRARVRTVLNAARHLAPVRRVATAQLPTEFGEFTIHVFENGMAGVTHVALVRGEIGDGEQLHAALRRIAEEGRGVLLYLNQEGRGIGLANKIRAYALQEAGCDTVEANARLGFPADLRDYRAAIRMLQDLGVRSTRLMSNNPRKLAGITGQGLSVSERLPIEILANASNARYLKTKKDKLGHLLSSV